MKRLICSSRLAAAFLCLCAVSVQAQNGLPGPRTWIEPAPAAELAGLPLPGAGGNGRESVPTGLVPDALLALHESIQHVLVADLHGRRLYLLANDGEPRLLRQMYASIGKNGSGKQIEDDGRTPVGIYQVTRYLDDAELPPLYGSGAFPVDYPNGWDRRLGRSGYGIWVHGVPRESYSRPPRSSEGCVAVGNTDFESLRAFVEPGRTPVIFSDRLNWVSQDSLTRQAAEFREHLDAWLAAWNRIDTESYLAYYAADFRSNGMDRSAFAAHKRSVNAGKSFIDVRLQELSLYRYPADEPLILAEFEQDYRSNNFQLTDRKRQFWRRDADGVWRIVLESSS